MIGRFLSSETSSRVDKCPGLCDSLLTQVVFYMLFLSLLLQTCGGLMLPVSSCDCPHLDCVGEITKEELIQKSHVSACTQDVNPPLRPIQHTSPYTGSDTVHS